MTKAHSRTLIFICVSGILLISWCAFKLFELKPWESIDNLILAIGSAFFGIGAQAAIDSFQRKERLFKRFFGSRVSSKQGFPAVFLSAELPPWPPGWDRTPASNMRLSDPPAQAGNTLPKGVEHIIPFEDLKAVLSIDKEFRKYDCRLEPEVDRYKSDGTPLPAGCLSVGLGYNNVTLRLQKYSNGLYDVLYDKNSDDVILGNRYLNPVPAPADCDDYALIARVLVRCSDTETVPFIVCAGHTASATVRACLYLADNWDNLVDKYKTHKKQLDKHSMGVLFCIKGSTHFLYEPQFREALDHDQAQLAKAAG